MEKKFIVTKKISEFIDYIQKSWNSFLYRLMFKKYK